MEHQDWEPVVLRRNVNKPRDAVDRHRLRTKKKTIVNKKKGDHGRSRAIEEADHPIVQAPSVKIGTAIQKARMEAGMTRKELAMRLSCAANLLTSYETGKANPTNAMIAKMERILKSGKLPRVKKVKSKS